MRRRTFLENGTINISDVTGGDICLYDKEKLNKIFVSYENLDSSVYPSTRFVPIGVVVVPSSHNRYGKNECAVVSLKYMITTNPNNGSLTPYSICFGSYYVSTGEEWYNEIVYTGNTGSANGLTNDGYLPSDVFENEANKVQCYDDNDAWYYSYNRDKIPSAYKTDDKVNPIYSQTSSPSSFKNCLSDFDGVGHTTYCTNHHTSQYFWKTESKINGSTGEGYYPAACCCWRYYTEGTKQGDWYLPAMGELGYIMPKLGKINNSLTKIATIYGSDTSSAIEIGSQNYPYELMSSTDYYSENVVWRIRLYQGVLFHGYDTQAASVRAFLRVK